MFYLHTSNSHHHCNVNLGKIFVFCFAEVNTNFSSVEPEIHKLILHLIPKSYFFDYQYEMTEVLSTPFKITTFLINPPPKIRVPAPQMLFFNHNK